MLLCDEERKRVSEWWRRALRKTLLREE